MRTCYNENLEPSNVEECEDGNSINGDGRNEGCMFETNSCSLNPIDCFNTNCGDRIRGLLEQCDDGNNNSSDSCASDCAQESYWTCQRENTTHPDQCIENCRNGRRFNSLSTYCDDSNNIPGDECSSICTVESGNICSGGSSADKDICEKYCGNGKIHLDEVCDDCNFDSKDRCNSECSVEDGWICNGGSQNSSSICRLKCTVNIERFAI
ncbi:unnamed protein product [Moneuplotes crassus]|uniref:Uncharacterized protein n=1 Tax=Euplotes crassus TaxID=5936 RepID=A0AAD2D7X9_EUPCR|nr:unnamed protein product [Moneuplotes crassus]